MLNLLTKSHFTFKLYWHGLKVGPQDPLQNLKVGPQDLLQSFIVGPPHLS